MEAKHTKDSQTMLNQLMLPEHANFMGNVHGGIIMKLVDETAGLCAIRHAQRPLLRSSRSGGYASFAECRPENGGG